MGKILRRGPQKQTSECFDNRGRERSLATEDPRIAHQDIAGILKISSRSISAILHDPLLLQKLCSIWIPRALSDAQKNVRVEWCHMMKMKFNDSKHRGVFVVTGDVKRGFTSLSHEQSVSP
ncbi:hypothetical protein TNIN_338611 [Trichonephila inaurata madagascariensis]|uniref:Uncharacterized protein n=1 Tax=Trichonephila inaurata madagascariensis TaxID=2747483 RepID=A0A8X6WT00_9ARAC|nr:hypothetical protein TNIN_338611 [Trichonephila inaurata madagascariensis]